MNRFLLPAVLLVMAGALAQIRAGTVNAQERVGELRLEVIDPSGRALEAAGNLENTRTGVIRRFQTDAHGGCTLKESALWTLPGRSIQRRICAAIGAD